MPPRTNPSWFHLLLLAAGGVILLFIIAPLAGMFLKCSGEGMAETAVDSEVWNSILMTIGVSACATFLCAIPAIPFAYLLARKEFFGKRLILGVIDLPVVIPHTAAGIALLGVLSRDSLVGAFAEKNGFSFVCLLYTSDAADDVSTV